MFSDRSKQIKDLIESLNLKQDVVLCGFVSDSALPGVYGGACMVAFPSLHEGFGLPIIEGFVSQVPVLTSNLCSMPEIAGDSAAIVDPYNVNDIYEKMKDILFNKTYSESLVQSGLNRVKYFTWENCTNQILSHITSLLKK
jgi:glycosyltransferase involved in cell wall biosynthesis